jgi:HEPN domain-containing protein
MERTTENTNALATIQSHTIYLTQDEVNSPLLVIADFFYDDWLPGHLERLKTWRDFVLKETYYLDEKNSPAGLLRCYMLNIRLIEALYLFEICDSNHLLVQKATDPAPLERCLRRDYPTNLTEDEFNEPLKVISNFFKYYTLQQYREQLYEWLEHGLSSKAAHEFITTADLVGVYENLQKLYSAAWVIYQRLAEKPYLKKIFHPNHDMGNIKTNKLRNFYKLNTDIPNSEQEKTSSLIGIIKHKVPTVQCVIYLGAAPENTDKLFLLVLTSRDETETAQSLNCLIEDRCKPIATVTAMCHYTTALLTALENNSRFFHQAMNCPVIYLSGNFILPVPKPLDRIAANESANFKWNHWLQQGKDFLSGADFYLRQESANTALFSLHQCAECVLIALIRGVNGYGTTNHNLSRLLAITEMFTTEIANVFQRSDSDKAVLFESLKQAYFNVRYKDAYKADMATAQALFTTVQRLLDLAEKVYARHILTEDL